MSEFEKIYLEILNEEKSPITFTPELLLDDIVNKCFWSDNIYLIYTFDQIISLCEDNFENNQLFHQMIKYQKDKFDYSIIIVYFKDLDNINDYFNSIGYVHKNNKYNFSMKEVAKQFKEYYQNPSHIANNFNSIDIAPELGCVIGLNGNNILTHRDFEKELDHELNHYFEGLHVIFNNKQKVKLDNNPNKNIINILSNYYGIDFNKKNTIIEDIKYHLFHEDEFRSMSANVFHEILKYNEIHLNQLKREELISDICKCNYSKYPIYLQEMIIFAYICHELSSSRWLILLKGIDAALNIKKNIFQKVITKLEIF